MKLGIILENRKGQLYRAFLLIYLLYLLLALVVERSSNGKSISECTASTLCKYSVRDVGFVEVHSFGWQLTLAKPDGISESEFVELDKQIHSVLEKTNVSHLWVSLDSQSFQNQIASVKNPAQNAAEITGILSNTKDQCHVFSDWDLTRENRSRTLQALELLVGDPIRNQILNGCSRSLCVVVLIEGNDVGANARAGKLLTATTQKLEKQMWLLEKPTESPPQSLLISVDQTAEATWLKRTLGLPDPNQPCFGIFYGQGRRLGEWIPLKDATVDKLVGRASICGGDCECDLDRDWLYGHQFIHRWEKSLERQAEETLNFDPHAAYVKSEVATIVRKAGRNAGNTPSINLGPGLIIHDLEPLESNSQPPQKVEPNASQSPSTAQSPVLPEKERNAVSEDPKKEHPVPPEQQNSLTWFPVSLVLLLVAGVGIVFYWSLSRGGS